MELVITILQLLCGLAIIVVVLFQQSARVPALSGAIGGVADSFLSRNKAKTWDAKLARATKWGGGPVPDPDADPADPGRLSLERYGEKHPDGSDPRPGSLLSCGRRRVRGPLPLSPLPAPVLSISGAVQHAGLRLDAVGPQQLLHCHKPVALCLERVHDRQSRITEVG